MNRKKVDLILEILMIYHLKISNINFTREIFLVRTYYFRLMYLNNCSNLEYNCLYLVFVWDSSFRTHKFVLQYPTVISTKWDHFCFSIVKTKPTSISSFFFNNCANSARVSRKTDVLSLFAVGLAAVVVAVAVGVVVVVVVVTEGVVDADVESFIMLFFFSFTFKQKNKKKIFIYARRSISSSKEIEIR